MATRVKRGLDPRDDEIIRVGKWRREQFEEMLEKRGVSARMKVTLAKRLAESDADVRKAERMLAEGCTAALLSEILT